MPAKIKSGAGTVAGLGIAIDCQMVTTDFGERDCGAAKDRHTSYTGRARALAETIVSEARKAPPTPEDADAGSREQPTLTVDAGATQ